jgi:sodium-dependent dicarboxylate transporter 2/3/5
MSKRHQKIGLVLGLAAFAAFAILWRNTEYPTMGPMAGIAVLMAVWWMGEAVPLPATALLPIALFPCLRIMSAKTASSLFFNKVIFLFLGGFIIALAMKKCNLHRRIALGIIAVIGSRPRQIVFGFMCATAFLSMWVSNTATTVMMVPIAMSVIDVVGQKIGRPSSNSDETVSIAKHISPNNFALTLMLGIAYAASIGGVATLIGTPTNLILAQVYETQFPEANPISFAGWFVMAFPLSIVFLAVAWFTLTRVLFPTADSRIFDGQDVIRQERAKLGPISTAEMRVLGIFLATAFLWLFRMDINLSIGTSVIEIPGWSNMLGIAEHVDDGTVAMVMAILLFIIPSGQNKEEKLMDWETAAKLPWGILLLFGGGFALAGGFTESGLSQWIGEKLHFLAQYPNGVLVGGIGLLVTFLTELTSNMSTTSVLEPIIAGMAKANGIPPLLIMIPAALSASFAFMLPVATAPNAIVFASGHVPIRKMVCAGIVLNLIGVLLVVLTTLILTVRIFS